MAIQYIDQADFQKKKVVARFDFNVPLDKKNSEIITDTTRIDSCFETIRYILDQGAKKLVLMGHLGRPKGVRDPKFSMLPVAKYLAEQLDDEVTLTESALDSGIKTLLGLNQHRIILLENLRYHPEEKANDMNFAKSLASYGDLYVNDAFGTAHRKHASTYGINAYFPRKSYAGFLLKKEIQALDKIVKGPQKPFIAISGGAKISDKIKIIESLLVSTDALLIGGGMSYPFLKAKGHSIGKSLCSDEDVQLAKNILNSSAAEKLILPIDHLASETIDGPPIEISSRDIPENLMGLDIGPRTLDLYSDKLATSKTILWNGPMGLFENPQYAKGTLGMARIISKRKGEAFSLVGGGDSVAAIKSAKLENEISHVSTGGGATLEYIEKGTLPGIDALKYGVSL